MVVLPDPTSDKWPYFGHVYLRQDSLDPVHRQHHRHRPRDETLRLWNYHLPLETQKDQFKFVLFLQRLMTMVEEHYRNRHRHGDKYGEWKISKPIDDWYKQSIRDLSGLGVDENLMNGEWKKVIQRVNRKDAKIERREAERVHLKKKEKQREHAHHRYRGDSERRKKERERYRGYYEPSEDTRYHDLHVLHHKPKKEEKSKEPNKEKEATKGTPKWLICSKRHCSRTHEMVKCNSRCGLTSCKDKTHRCHKTYIDYACSDPDCEECTKQREKEEEWEKKVANPKFEEKWVDCSCEDPWCRRKVLEIKEIERPKAKLFVTKC
ncbi:hypothetical protein SBOR_3478 [Sclerotinia borealis F-4128]|uniref:Uncharacterized protein n=1 Tax=Sclerotinia borealis (strain F-4128) TaxID=1432307 RepID=W9CJF9_SCLBF|nr:hypothetical protein SBOR_3478 [Sclerotinia borealis F-4128]